MKTLPDTFIFILCSLLLISAPLLYSGKTALTLMILEYLGLGLLCLTLWLVPITQKLHLPVALFLTLSILAAISYLLPIPENYWHLLPHHGFYTEVVDWLKSKNTTPTFTLSLISHETQKALLTLVPAIAIFLATSHFDKNHLKQLVMIFLGVTSLEAALGLIQYSSNNPDFFFGIKANGNAAQGTYFNRDHFAALMETCLPFAIGFSLNAIGRHQHHHNDHLIIIKGNHFLIFASLSILILLGGIFSMSRTGIFLIAIAILLSSVFFARHIGGRQSASITGIISTITIGFITSIGLIPILNRFIEQDPLADGRWDIWQYTIVGIKAFFPVGSGPGTFPDVYRAFQPLEQQGFINHAHNDYLELMFDMGLAGMVIIGGFFLLYLYGWVKLWDKPWDEEHLMQNAAGISILLLLLHSLTDFNLHTPANMIIFGFLCAIFFRKTTIKHRRKMHNSK